jgi:flagellar basal-body rod protein FlgB
MNLSSLKMFQVLKEKMDWHGQNQRVSATNVANADTPDFKAQGLAPINFRKALERSGDRFAMAMERSNGLHVEGSTPPLSFKEADSQSIYDISPTGNAVTLEDEMLKMSNNAEDYRLTSQLYKKYANLFRIAIRGSGQG